MSDQYLFHIIILAVAVFFLLGMGIWIFSALMLASAFGLLFVADMPLSKVLAIFNGNLWTKSVNWEFACIPLFIWMGELLLRTSIAERMFRGIMPWIQWLPGRLLHTNIFGCTLFAAISGSSTATTMTIGKITSETLWKRGYDLRLAVGSLAGAGTLGLLIPPSIIMIVYGGLAEASIARLFAAGILPGLIVAGLFFLYVVIACLVKPELVPEEDAKQYSWQDRVRSLYDLLPVGLLIAIVLGGIYTGITTPTEAAAVGTFMALLLALFTKRLTPSVFINTLLSTIGTSCMVISIIIAASFLTSTMGYLQIPQNIAKAVSQLGIEPIYLIGLIFIFYLILGCFLEGISILVMTLPIVLPLVVHAGYDPIWFGIFAIIAIEAAQITPPVGLNLFVIQSLTGRNIWRLAHDALPFFGILLLSAILMMFFPKIALWLPDYLFNQ